MMIMMRYIMSSQLITLRHDSAFYDITHTGANYTVSMILVDDADVNECFLQFFLFFHYYCTQMQTEPYPCHLTSTTQHYLRIRKITSNDILRTISNSKLQYPKRLFSNQVQTCSRILLSYIVFGNMFKHV